MSWASQTAWATSPSAWWTYPVTPFSRCVAPAPARPARAAAQVGCAFRADAAPQDGTGDLQALRAYEEEFLTKLSLHRLPPQLQVEWVAARTSRRTGATIRTGRFLSPLAHLLPPEARWARVQLVSPPPGAPPCRALLLHFAATADQTFVLRRRLLAEPLLTQHRAASLLLMPAFYGARRPGRQTLHYTRTLCDFSMMTHATIAEGWHLAEWARGLTAAGGEFAGARLGVTGVSLGGAMAAVVGALSLGPLAISPCLGTWTGAGVYTDGGLAPQVAWRALAAEQGGSIPAARAHVRAVLEHNDVGALVARLSGTPGQGPRTLVMVNAVDDGYVAAREPQHLFAVLAPTCGTGDAVHRWISGGHITSVLGRAHTFVAAVVESLDLLDARLASDEAADLAAASAQAAAAVAAQAQAQAEEAGAEAAAQEAADEKAVASLAAEEAPRARL